MKKVIQSGYALSMWAAGDPGSGSLCDLLHLKRQDENTLAVSAKRFSNRTDIAAGSAGASGRDKRATPGSRNLFFL